MTLRHYQIFCEVAKTKNFTKAAQNLYITQSAVSYAMKELEEEAGTALFERLAKSVKLTSCGELLLQEVQPVLSQCDKLSWRIHHLQEDAPITIVSCMTIAQTWLPNIVKKFQEKYPSTPVNVEVIRASEAITLLNQGTCDIAFIEGELSNPNYQITPLHTYPLIAICAKDANIPLELTIESFLSYPLLLREKGSAVRDVFESMLVIRGYQCTPHWTSVDSQTLMEAAAHGLGIAILPEVLAQEAIEKNKVKCIHIPDFPLYNQGVAVMRKDTIMTHTLENFWKLMQEEVEE